MSSSPPSTPVLELPAAYLAADTASLQSQRTAVMWTAIQLALFFVAALGGLFDWKIRGGTVNLGGLLSVAAFTGALAVGFSASSRASESAWYRERAAAESIKTLAWRYAVRGAPFLGTALAAEDLFLRRVRQVLREMGSPDLPPITGHGQITESMRALRSTPLRKRVTAYEVQRIDDQCAWYTRKALANRRHMSLLSGLAGCAAGLGIVGGLLRSLGVTDVDYLGAVATLGASFNAWGQMRQHRTLAASYAVTAQELELIKASIHYVRSEAEWAQLVADSESSISREHALWMAKRSQTGSELHGEE